MFKLYMYIGQSIPVNNSVCLLICLIYYLYNEAVLISGIIYLLSLWWHHWYFSTINIVCKMFSNYI